MSYFFSIVRNRVVVLGRDRVDLKHEIGELKACADDEDDLYEIKAIRSVLKYGEDMSMSLSEVNELANQ